MNTPPTPPKRGLLDGVGALINTTVNAPAGPTGYHSVTTAKHLSGGGSPNLDLKRLVNDLWRQIVVNWVEDGCQSRGKNNWRWELRPEGGKGENQPEVALQRKIACFIKEEGQEKHWSNETPTGSGLSKSKRGNPGALDLARKHGDKCVDIIELKFKDNEKPKDKSNTPISAAFQIVQYGLMLTLARLVNDKVRIIVDDAWRDAKSAQLLVLAPHSFYLDYLGLGWFEKRLDEAVSEFGSAHGLHMRFAFREFTAKPTTESELIERLGEKGKIPWK